VKRVRWIALLLLVVCVVTLSAVGACGKSSARSKALVNVDPQGIGAHGYDPVAFLTQGKTTKGDPQWHRTYGGATYCLHANRNAFDGAPAKYAPQYGGYRAMAMAMRKLEGVHFLVHNDEYLFQLNEKAHMMFSSFAGPEHLWGYRAQASVAWHQNGVTNT
jgi:hypothetical protein